MNYLRQSTGIDVRIGPAVDATDGVTPETTLDLSTADQAEILKANGAATVSISAATMVAVTGADGWYDLTLTTAHTDTVGEMVIVIQDSSLCLPIFARFQVVTAAVYDKLFDGSASLNDLSAAQVNAECDTAISDAALATSAALATVDTKVDILDGKINTVDNNVDAILVDTGTDIPAALTTVGDNVSKILKSAFAGTELSISDVTSQTDPVALGGPGAGSLVDALFVFFDVSDSDKVYIGEGQYNGNAGTCELDAALPITLAVGDKVTVIAVAASATAGDIADAVLLETVADHSGTSGSLAAVLSTVATDTTTDIPATLATLATSAALATVDTKVDILDGKINTVDNNVDAILVDTGTTIPAQIAALNDPTAAAIADAVWLEIVADHSGTAGSTAEALAAAGGAGDPWITTLPGSYTGTQAGKILADVLTDTGTELPANLATLATSAAVTTVDTVVDAIKVKTDQLTFTVASNLDANIQYINDAAVVGDGNATPWDGA